MAEIEAARTKYELVEHGKTFLAEIETVLDVIQAMPLRLPIIYSTIHRALLRHYPFAVFFRIRPATDHVVVLAVLPQRSEISAGAVSVEHVAEALGQTGPAVTRRHHLAKGAEQAGKQRRALNILQGVLA
ncbi:MAG: hypothetical protein H0X17_00570 [Deltaproteobacteria bacterium]|nr:hypothetical protein [Deltaproteobacteria bacterium]